MRTPLLAITVATTLALGLAACGKKDEATDQAAKSAMEQSKDAAKQAVDNAGTAVSKAADAAKVELSQAASDA